MQIKAFWPIMPKPGNMGDLLNKYILEQCGHTVSRVGQNEGGKVLCIGSMIKFAKEDDIVWGTGAMSDDVRPNPKAKYLAVRGPITRNLILNNGGKCPKIYGDPAILMPKFYKPQIDKKYDIGIVPHYVDFQIAVNKFGNRYRVINILDANPLNVIDEILKCKRILSSSLHGIIIAQTYGIPAAWIKFSNKIKGDGTKYYDYFISTGQKLHSPLSPLDIKDKMIILGVKLKINRDKLWEARP